MASIKPTSSELYEADYERDYHAWIRAQVGALRERRIEDIDFDNVAKEIEDLGKNEKRSVQSHLETLLVHSLKLSYASGITRDRDARLWENTIELARLRIRKLLDESPGLGRHLEELFDEAYRAARILMRRIGLPAGTAA
jgi:uncharacterized protein DUF29